MRAYAGYMGEGCHCLVAAFFGAMQADWVENDRTGETPQREGKEKQAGWEENDRTGENPQLEATEKQAGWEENGRAGENPQPEGKEKQAGWGRKWRNERKSPTGS